MKWKHPDIDGTWARLVALPDGIALELRDPNDGQSPDPDDKTRHQYSVAGWVLLKRKLPSISVGGDEWRDDDAAAPWWAPVLVLPPSGIVLDYWRDHATGVKAHEYEVQAHHAVGHVVAFAPNGREVRRDGSQLVVQPHNDNYWLRVPHLRAARDAYAHPERYR